MIDRLAGGKFIDYGRRGGGRYSKWQGAAVGAAVLTVRQRAYIFGAGCPNHSGLVGLLRVRTPALLFIMLMERRARSDAPYLLRRRV